MTTGHDPFNDHPTGLAMACALSALAGAVVALKTSPAELAEARAKFKALVG